MTEQEKDLMQPLFVRGGYYDCPKDPEGIRMGPMVGYAGLGANGLQKVGDKYFDYSTIEGTVHNEAFAAVIAKAVFKELNPESVVVYGMPMGGIYLAGEVARWLRFYTEAEAAFMEKKVTALATESIREQSILSFGRYAPKPGQKILLCDDVFNNGTTTGLAIDMFEEAGAEVIGILCAINRSWPSITAYERKGDKPAVAIIAGVTLPTEQWEQSDPKVASDLKRFPLVKKPKMARKELQKIMADLMYGQVT
ncbi:MAG: phosphoribosyltransferase [Patescibacteria group bacterium]|jgi:orotate phosphoribosyltransferase